mmetsp:Transcript_50227/g.89647  ORF Transcript_50227/g.89647 Transcript_50227/m.89647 type:complete len:253 (+) Transcript_50227:1478-2236(+)
MECSELYNAVNLVFTTLITSLMLHLWSGQVLSQASTVRSIPCSHSNRSNSSLASACSQPSAASVRRILQQKSSSGAGLAGFTNKTNFSGNCSKNLCHFFLKCVVTTASYSSGLSFLMMFCTRSEGTDPGCRRQKSSMAHCRAATLCCRATSFIRPRKVSDSSSECPTEPSEKCSDTSVALRGRGCAALTSQDCSVDFGAEPLSCVAGPCGGERTPGSAGHRPRASTPTARWRGCCGYTVSAHVVLRPNPGYQ